MLAALLLVAGCAPDRPEPLRIGTNVWPGYEPLYLARNLGFLDDASARLVEYSSATQVLDAFRNRAIDAAALTLDELLLLRSRGIDAQAVLVMDISNGADAVLARPPLSTLGVLKGKRVGVETTAVGAYVLSRALERAGLSTSDVTVVPTEIDNHERAYLEQRIDAVVTFDPVRSRLLAAGATRLFDSSEIPGEVVDVLVLHRDYAAAGPIQSVIAAWFRALDYLRENAGAAAQTMSLRLQLSPSQVLDSYAGLSLPDREENRRLLSGSPAPLATTAAKLSDVMVEQGLLAPLDVSRGLVNSAYLEGP